MPPPGVAVRGQHGGAALLPGGAHRAHQEALQQRHRLLCKAQRPARRRGLDGRLQVTRLHGLEHPHGSKYSSHSVLSRGRAPSCPSLALGGEGVTAAVQSGLSVGKVLWCRLSTESPAV